CGLIWHYGWPSRSCGTCHSHFWRPSLRELTARLRYEPRSPKKTQRKVTHLCIKSSEPIKRSTDLSAAMSCGNGSSTDASMPRLELKSTGNGKRWVTFRNLPGC